ncbi:KH homology domain-containing protein 1-like [Cavia porcellus]|uniref:KH homology domain-containing protein 1-like n=1 Tax=Cavia porcellus TaxID=10141 RepID=UPI00022B5EA3|nr:KH homology domain-containing protein 1-like [Cavia porcellus]
MEGIAGGHGPAWWTQPEHFRRPLVFYMDAELEERLFGGRDSDLRLLEEHSHTLIQLEAWATADGHTRVTVVGPLGAQRWLQELVRSLGSREPGSLARGLLMLQRVRSRPLSLADLDAAGRGEPPPGDLARAA